MPAASQQPANPSCRSPKFLLIWIDCRKTGNYIFNSWCIVKDCLIAASSVCCSLNSVKWMLFNKYSFCKCCNYINCRCMISQNSCVMSKMRSYLQAAETTSRRCQNTLQPTVQLIKRLYIIMVVPCKAVCNKDLTFSLTSSVKMITSDLLLKILLCNLRCTTPYLINQLQNILQFINQIC